MLRAIFRVCYGRYRHCQTKAAHLSEARLEAVPSKRGRIRLWSRKDQEYSADFCLVARRELTRDEWAVFKAHYLEQRDWRACVKRLKTDRGRFFHSVYRIQQKLGRAFRSVAPYALFPLDEYFSGTCAYVSDREFGWRVPPVTDHA